MSSRALSALAASFRKQGPFAVLGLGGALTIIWIVFLAWVPLQLTVSLISIALSEMRFM